MNRSSKTLIITEKPDAAIRIASAIDFSGRPKKCVMSGVPYYIAQREKEIIVVPAFGHMYTVGAKSKKREYPILEIDWIPRYKVDRKASRIKIWLGVISKLAQEADAFIDGCDYDLEGSIIGYCILKYACGNKENIAGRMKYSTLVKEELEKSYLEALPRLDFGLIEAGLTRHEVDWLFGINISRALTNAAKKNCRRYITLSTGRVQGPTLRFLAARERKIMCHVPTPLWNVNVSVEINGLVFSLVREGAPIQVESEAEKMAEDCRKNKCVVKNTERARSRLMPPSPFNLGSLQAEAYRVFKFTPVLTSKIAQHLYLSALISYPRTNSEKLPIAIGYKSILENLGKYSEFEKQVAEVLSNPNLRPTEGKLFDPAHPAIYPTGNLPDKKLEAKAKKLWTLIVKRFLAAFGEPAVRENTKINFDVAEHHFSLSGTLTLNRGWTRLYDPFLQLYDYDLPNVKKGQEVEIKKVVLESDFTKPLPRFTPGTLLRKMEREEIGTKSTRAGIIHTLYDRKYVSGEKIKVTELGLQVIEVLNGYCPSIVKVDFTRELEHKMDEIQKGRVTKEEVLSVAIESLKLACSNLKEAENVIGRKLGEVVEKNSIQNRTIGNCPTCGTGQLVILRSKSSGKRFVGCTNYFKGNCKTAFPLPQKGLANPLKRSCAVCGWPMVGISLKTKRVWRLCLNPNCSSKKKDSKE